MLIKLKLIYILIERVYEKMGTWVACPNCIKNLPKKYQNKKERKEIHQATCDGCKNKVARKHYEVGVKRGIWLKKWKKASESFIKASTEFQNINEEDSQLQSEIMGLLSNLYDEKNIVVAEKVFQKIISGRYDRFIGQNFKIQGFLEFDPLYNEAKAWNEYFKIESITNIHDKTSQMKATAHEFFNIGYNLLFFSTHILKRKITNVEFALNLEAISEVYLGDFYASRNDVDFASVHLSNAVSIYLSLEQKEKAKELKMTRQSLRMETACWICGARSKGHKKSFNFKFTGLAEDYYDMTLSLLKQRQERNPTFFNNTVYTTKEPIKVIQNQDVKNKDGKQGIYLSTCITCQGLVDELAQDIVDRALIPVWEAITSLKSEINNIYSLINDLKSQMDSLKRKMYGFKRG